VVTAPDVLSGRASVEKKLVIAGGGQVGLETADFIVEKGLAQDVTILEMLPAVGQDMDPRQRAYMLRNVIPRRGVKIRTDAQVEEITDKGIVVLENGRQRNEVEAETVVLAMGYTPNRVVYEALKGKIKELYVIGDAVKPRKIKHAIHEGAYFAHQI
jgi:pyruvate/2-oxoglutarate dehydrogenase complex dihydrolipoamide dehydrogenase (E3) component